MAYLTAEDYLMTATLYLLLRILHSPFPPCPVTGLFTSADADGMCTQDYSSDEYRGNVDVSHLFSSEFAL